jgi:hypothetical protein
VVLYLPGIRQVHDPLAQMRCCRWSCRNQGKRPTTCAHASARRRGATCGLRERLSRSPASDYSALSQSGGKPTAERRAATLEDRSLRNSCIFSAARGYRQRQAGRSCPSAPLRPALRRARHLDAYLLARFALLGVPAGVPVLFWCLDSARNVERSWKVRDCSAARHQPSCRPRQSAQGQSWRTDPG